MTLIRLSHQEHQPLADLSTQTRHAHELRRAQALLWVDGGERIATVAERLCVTRQSVYNWIKRFQTQGTQEISARLAEGARSGRPRTAHGIIDPLILDVIDRDPRELGYRSTVWTAPLFTPYLAETPHIEVSRQSVRLAIARLGLRWKRPRHDLVRRSKTWRQAKGGSHVA
jgi:transposase